MDRKLKNWRKNQHGIWETSRAKKEVILEVQRDEDKVHFATLMDMCHLKNAELEPRLQKYKGRVVLPATKVMDVISRLPDCDGQAADAVSAYTHVKLEDAPRLLKIPKSECSDIWIRLPRHKWPNIEDPVVRLERSLDGPLSRIVMGRTVRGSSIGSWMGKSTTVCLLIESKDYFYRFMWMISKLRHTTTLTTVWVQVISWPLWKNREKQCHQKKLEGNQLCGRNGERITDSGFRPKSLRRKLPGALSSKGLVWRSPLTTNWRNCEKTTHHGSVPRKH